MKTINLLVVFFLICIIFSRFYNLDVTARFTEDESLDLVRIHQIYVDRDLTFIGPRNDQGTKVFSSLTHYMLLPTSIIGGFDPVSPAYGAAFFGVLTALLIVVLTRRINKHLTFLVAILVIVWYPLLETSRWAWNPNLIPFWSALALICFTYKTRLSFLLTGVLLGLTVHQHYFAIFTLVLLGSMLALGEFKEKRLDRIFLFILGAFITLIPFYIFDLLHPPGLFLTGFSSQASQSSLEVVTILQKFMLSLDGLIRHYTQNSALSLLLVVSLLGLFVADIKSRNRSLMYFIVWIGQIAAIALIPQFFAHYLIPVLIVFIAWVIYPRDRVGKLLSIITLLILILGGVLSFIPYLTTQNFDPSLPVFRRVTSIVSSQIKEGKINNANIAVLASKDRNTEGKRYRDLLLVENVVLSSKYEYFNSDYLFVVSSSSEEIVRADYAAEMHVFRSGQLVNQWTLDPNWKLYLFARGQKNS